MKKLFYEVIGIIVLSGLAGIIYNFFTTKPLPLIYKQAKIETVSDTMLTISKSLNNYPNQSAARLVDSFKQNSDNTIISKKETERNQEISEQNKPEKNLKEAIVKNVSFEQVLKHLNNPQFLLIDARKPEMFSAGHIGAAINIDAYPDEMNEYFRLITQLPRDKIIIVYCDGGNCEASHKLAKDIMSFGYPKVFVYTGGWDEWTKKNKNL